MSALPPRKPTAIDEVVLAFEHVRRAAAAHGTLELDEVHRHLLGAASELTAALKVLEAKRAAELEVAP